MVASFSSSYELYYCTSSDLSPSFTCTLYKYGMIFLALSFVLIVTAAVGILSTFTFAFASSLSEFRYFSDDYDQPLMTFVSPHHCSYLPYSSYDEVYNFELESNVFCAVLSNSVPPLSRFMLRKNTPHHSVCRSFFSNHILPSYFTQVRHRTLCTKFIGTLL